MRWPSREDPFPRRLFDCWVALARAAQLHRPRRGLLKNRVTRLAFLAVTGPARDQKETAAAGSFIQQRPIIYAVYTVSRTIFRYDNVLLLLILVVEIIDPVHRW